MRQNRIRLSLLLLIFFGLIGIGNAQVVITGVVTGYDGKPMPTAQVRLVNAAEEPIDETTAAQDGVFELRAAEAGVMRLRFAGPLHAPKDTLLLVEKPQRISLRVRLSTPEYSTELTDLRLRTDDPKSPLHE